MTQAAPDPSQGMNAALPQSPILHVGGLMAVVPASQLIAEQKAAAEQAQQAPVIQGLASYVKQCWNTAYMAKRQTVEERMLQCVRQRNGEYDPGILAEIKKSGGSEIYMLLTSVKCRAAASWIKDVMLGTQDQKPWAVTPTKEPELPPDAAKRVAQMAAEEAQQYEQDVAGAQQVGVSMMKDLVALAKDRLIADAKAEAAGRMTRMESKMEDQLQEGGFYEALSDFIDDVVTFPFAVIKGPVPRNTKQLTWLQGPDGQWTADVQEKVTQFWERVDPFAVYWAPHSADVDDGYLIERHHLTREALSELIGVDGYKEDAIRAVLDEYGRTGLHDWLYIDVQKAQVEGKSVSAVMSNPEGTIDALQFWGSVSGKMLVEWGVDEAEVPDQAKEYCCEVWMIGRWVIKATLNYDKLGRKPYYKACYEEIPGGWCGNGVADLVRDCQSMCNYAARSLSNNMGIASGPQAYVNVDRLATGEDVTQMHPWRLWQTISDPFGSTNKPIEYFTVPSIASELLMVYERFSLMADEYSGVPRYMTGDAGGQGALRTSSGFSMMMGNAGKAIKQVIGNIDAKVIQKLIERLYYYNMRYVDDPELKGDVRVVARGVNALMVKEQAQQRRNEFLQIVLSAPAVQQIIGPEAVATLMRESAKGLDMDVDKLIPPPEVIRANMAKAQQQQQQQQAIQMQLAQQPQQTIDFKKDADGTILGANVHMKFAPGQGPGMPMSGNGQTLQNGAPVTDLFSPKRSA